MSRTEYDPESNRRRKHWIAMLAVVCGWVWVASAPADLCDDPRMALLFLAPPASHSKQTSAPMPLSFTGDTEHEHLWLRDALSNQDIFDVLGLEVGDANSAAQTANARSLFPPVGPAAHSTVTDASEAFLDISLLDIPFAGGGGSEGLIDARYLSLEAADRKSRSEDTRDQTPYLRTVERHDGGAGRIMANDGRRNAAGPIDGDVAEAAATKRRNALKSLDGKYFFDWPWVDDEGTNIFFWVVGPPAFAVVFVFALAAITGYIKHSH